jgi:hypothetical protein
MTREERQYFYNKLAQLFNNWANEHINDSATIGSKMIESFVDRHMTTITGQQLLPQDVFRIFLGELSKIIAGISGDSDISEDDINKLIFGNLTTTDKTIVGAVNEVQSKLSETTRGLEIVEGDTATLKTEVAELQEDLSGKQDASEAQEMFEELAAKTTTPIVVHDSNVVTIQPNVMNVWKDTVSNLKVIKGDVIEGIVNNYMIRFTAGNETVVIFEGEEVKWYGGEAPTWTADNTYEISIVDNIALWAEF